MVEILIYDAWLATQDLSEHGLPARIPLYISSHQDSFLSRDLYIWYIYTTPSIHQLHRDGKLNPNRGRSTPEPNGNGFSSLQTSTQPICSPPLATTRRLHDRKRTIEVEKESERDEQAVSDRQSGKVPRGEGNSRQCFRATSPALFRRIPDSLRASTVHALWIQPYVTVKPLDWFMEDRLVIMVLQKAKPPIQVAYAAMSKVPQ